MKNKSTSSFLIFILFVISSVFISNEINAQEKDKDSVESKLKDKIEMLEERTQKQQNEIENLKKEIDELKKTRPWLAVPELKDNDNFRKGKRFKFNGKIYYMIPLNSGNIKNDVIK